MRRLGLLALLVIAAIGAFAGWLDSQISRPYRGHRPEKVFVDIPRGTSRCGISGILAKNDVIRNRFAFDVFSLWHMRKPLQAGEYLFDAPLNSKEAFWKIAEGKIFVHISSRSEKADACFRSWRSLERQSISALARTFSPPREIRRRLPISLRRRRHWRGFVSLQV